MSCKIATNFQYPYTINIIISKSEISYIDYWSPLIGEGRNSLEMKEYKYIIS